MANTVTTIRSQINNAEQFREKFSEANPTISYVFIGNHLAYQNEDSPEEINDTLKDQKNVWDKMFAAKRVTGNDVELVVPRINWTGSTRYRQFDDTIEYLTLLSSNTELNLKPMYVITSERNVYKCLSNNSNSLSTIEPTGDYSTSNGVIDTGDGFRWKYLYNIKPANKFLTNEWIPVPSSKEQLDYGMNSLGIVDGELTTIVVSDGGTNYTHANINVSSFSSGTNRLSISNTTLVLDDFNIQTLSNLNNMLISGLGIRPGSYISGINASTGIITLSSNTSANGGGTTNPTSLRTRVVIEGDGIGAEASAFVGSSGNIANIKITTVGTSYSYANASVYGSGSGANTRVIISPKFGHAFNPVKEIGGKNVMIAVRIGEIDSTEDGLISSNTNFRQYGLLRDPHKYGSTSPVTSNQANTVISQTTNLSLVAGSEYQLNEFVYQGIQSNPSAYGYVIDQTESTVKLTGVRGIMLSGQNLSGANSLVQRTIVTVRNPEFQPYTGDILYADNFVAIDREEGQAEEIKFVLKF